MKRSNSIVARLVNTARKCDYRYIDWMNRLPLYLNIELQGESITILHGDADSLSGWKFAAEAIEHMDETLQPSSEQEQEQEQVRVRVNECSSQLHQIDITTKKELQTYFHQLNTSIVACTHTCLPVATTIPLKANKTGILINNGAAGMPNFKNMKAGVITRIASEAHGPPPGDSSLYKSVAVNGLRVDAMSVNYDWHAWLKDFQEPDAWPPRTAAYDNYWNRIQNGPDYAIHQAMRAGFSKP
jgi:hypothetical protein